MPFNKDGHYLLPPGAWIKIQAVHDLENKIHSSELSHLKNKKGIKMNDTVTNVAIEATDAPLYKERNLDSNVEAGLIEGSVVVQTPSDQGDETNPIN